MADEVLRELLGGILDEMVRIRARQDQIFQSLRQLTRSETDMGSKLSDVTQQISTLQTSVTNETAVVGSAVTLLNGLSAQYTAIQQQLADAIANGDPAAIQAANDNLVAINSTVSQQTTTLAAAVAANTPAAATSGSTGSTGSGSATGGSSGTSGTSSQSS